MKDYDDRVTAEDRAEITELFARYAWTGDVGDVEGYVDLFTEDGIFDGVSGYYDGPDELRRWPRRCATGLARAASSTGSGTRSSRGDSERCVVTSMCFAPRRIENEHSIVFVGYYVDTCVKVDGRLKFEVRRWRPWAGDVVRGARPWRPARTTAASSTRRDRAQAARRSDALKVYELIADVIAAHEVDTVFGLLGDGNMLALAALVDRHGARLVTRHENAAVLMADGWARTTGRVGVASVTCGPGLTQVATALTGAVRNRTPLVCSPRDVPSARRGTRSRSTRGC